MSNADNMKKNIKIKGIHLIILFMILFGGMIVYSYNTSFFGSNPQVMGHSADEVNFIISDSFGQNNLLNAQYMFNNVGGMTLCELNSKELREKGCPPQTFLSRIGNVSNGEGNPRDAFCKIAYSTTDNSLDYSNMKACWTGKHREDSTTSAQTTELCKPGTGAPCNKAICDCVPSVDGVWLCSSTGMWTKTKNAACY